VRDRLILDLCAGSGSWSVPYEKAGYIVRRVDLPTDVRLADWDALPIHGILAAPPCTYFCRMRMCQGRPTDEQFREGLSVVDACLRIITMTKPKWWALENPAGYLGRWLGPPSLKFDPWEYGDPWTKRTWLWGKFTQPLRAPIAPTGQWVDDGSNDGLSGDSRTNSITPPGFAQAFFEANP
jgi:hypothetical protein